MNKKDVQSIIFLKALMNNNEKDSSILATIIKKHKELNDLARKAQDAYYNSGNIIMEDKAYDDLFDKIKSIEDQYNYHPNWSVINSAGIKGSKKVEKAGKCVHEFPCLSQDKTKDRNELKNWLKDYEGILSWKNDGNTLVLTYDNGQLTMAASRGNGTEGTIITEFAKTQNCIPKTIKDTGHFVVRGEYLMSFDMFNKLNANLKPGEAPYKNPRNLATGTTTLLDMSICKQRQGEFHVFELAKCTGFDKIKTYEEQLKYCKEQGFEIVGYKKVNKDNILNVISEFEGKVKTLGYPTDGLVLRYNDRELEKLGYTGHAPKFSIAFKWKDDTVETKLRKIEWNASRTGRINPVAIFDSVEIEGSTVSRATLNNLTFIKTMKLGIGDTIEVYKANMIIPTILCSHEQSNNIQIPTKCPSCGSDLKVKKDGVAEFLMCENPDCNAKQLNKFITFAGKQYMNIDGISGKTIESIIDLGILKKFSDFYDLPKYKTELCSMEGFGEKAYKNLCESIEKSKKDVEPYKVLAALTINNVGINTAKDIMAYFNNDFEELFKADEDDIMNINGIGMTVASSIVSYFRETKNIEEVKNILSKITLKTQKVVNSSNSSNSGSLSGRSFCITGSLYTMKNRDEFINKVEANGGTYISSVKKGLTFLVTNDPNSGSSKNKKAQELGISIITENDFLRMIHA